MGFFFSHLRVFEKGLAVKREYLAKKNAEDAQRLLDIAALEPEVAELKRIMDGYWEITNQLEAKERAIKSEYENAPASEKNASAETETSDIQEDPIPDPPEVLAAKKAAQDARAEYNTHFNAYSAKYTQLETIQNEIKMDLGFDGGLGVLLNQCLEHHTHEYTYKLCFFDTAAQKGKDQFMETSLGTWNGFTGKDLTAFSGKNLKYTEGEFINGQGCWQGPQRSVRVSFECGAKNEIVAFSEPNKCEYAARVTTPGLCESDEDVANRGKGKVEEDVKEVSRDDIKDHGRDNVPHESTFGYGHEHDEL
ncbi:hypothetical protein HDU81_008473 [Chytriomyces hyalinus]|nr:hypothetical protein HDU81_008473 [Chytriomyces hyalinus]